MDLSVEMCSTTDDKGVTRLMWLPSDCRTNPVKFEGLRIVVFHHFEIYAKELSKWTDLIDQLALEYAGLIQFSAQDIKSIETFHSSLRADDFGTFRSSVPPLVFGLDNDDYTYTMHMLCNYRYLKDFCDKLVRGQLFEAIVLNPIEEFDQQPQNFNHLAAGSTKDLFVLFYDPCSYYWCIQLAKLRKLAKLLAEEDIVLVIVNRGHNYLGVDFNKWAKLSSLQSATTFVTKRPNGWISNELYPEDNTKGYLRHIAQHRTPELIGFDSEGMRKCAENTVEDIRHLYHMR